MKTSLKWLKHYIEIPWTAKELAAKLTSAGLEVEGIDQVGGVPPGVVIGQVLTRAPHPNAEKLSVCTVDIGGPAPLQIVCGAPNCDAGNKIPVATVGTKFSADFVIKQAKLRGVESSGMMCSKRELGLGQDHEGLFILPADAPLGLDFNKYMEPDFVIDWEVTPNRSDWLSHIGIAREIAAVTATPANLRFPAVTLPPASTATIEQLAAVEVLDTDLCPRYVARVVRNIKIGPSPKWLADALASIGLRPINNVVDITNYVMYECGQPLHSFDYDKLAGHKIIVRRAYAGEKMQTLDNKEFALETSDLVIADAEKAVALAGVMGGLNSEIAETTTTVLLESAAFKPAAIRATAKRLCQHSDSSYRFSRGSDLERVEWASRRATQLLVELCGGELAAGSLDIYPAPYSPHQVSARFQRVRDLIGMPLTDSQIEKYLNDLGLATVEKTAETITIAVPSWRLDITREADLIEEACRLFGLDNVMPGRPTAVLGGDRKDDTYYPLQEVREQLMGLGLTETMTYSLVSQEEALKGSKFTEENLVKLSNPLSLELAYMRPTLAAGLLQTVGNNVSRNTHDLAFFELGRVIVSAKGYPEERWQIAIGLTGRETGNPQGSKHSREMDFYDLKGIIEGFLAIRRLGHAVCRPCEHPAFRTGRCAEYVLNEKQLVVFGEMAGSLTKGMRLKTPMLAAFIEFDWLRQIKIPAIRFQPLPLFPATARDITLVAASELAVGEITATIEKIGGKLLEAVELVDIFADDKAVGVGKRSLSFQLTYRDPAQTLTDDKVNKEHDRIRAALAQKLPIELR
jgi:phenylalanyl-tRNA synthetase beta chain